jgi:hypothetical protein
MAQIIPLQSRARPSRPAPAHEGGAQILFFLGVRYMRMEDPLLTPGGAPEAHGGHNAGGKKRKRRARA